MLLLPDGTVIEESLEIMQHVLHWQLSEEEAHWVERNDEEFKFRLDRYKYPNRYNDVDEVEHRTLASAYLVDLNVRLGEGSAFAAQLNDALFPFVRQFANHDRDWFDAQPWSNVTIGCPTLRVGRVQTVHAQRKTMGVGLRNRSVSLNIRPAVPRPLGAEPGFPRNFPPSNTEFLKVLWPRSAAV